MKLTVNKPKTWAHFSYVLKTSMLEKALEGKGHDDTKISLEYWTPQHKGDWFSLLEAEYLNKFGNAASPYFTIRAGVVPRELRKNAEEMLLNQVLPGLPEWMDRVSSIPHNSTQKGGGFYAWLREGRLELIIGA